MTNREAVANLESIPALMELEAEKKLPKLRAILSDSKIKTPVNLYPNGELFECVGADGKTCNLNIDQNEVQVILGEVILSYTLKNYWKLDSIKLQNEHGYPVSYMSFSEDRVTFYYDYDNSFSVTLSLDVIKDTMDTARKAILPNYQLVYEYMREIEDNIGTLTLDVVAKKLARFVRYQKNVDICYSFMSISIGRIDEDYDETAIYEGTSLLCFEAVGVNAKKYGNKLSDDEPITLNYVAKRERQAENWFISNGLIDTGLKDGKITFAINCEVDWLKLNFHSLYAKRLTIFIKYKAKLERVFR